MLFSRTITKLRMFIPKTKSKKYSCVCTNTLQQQQTQDLPIDEQLINRDRDHSYTTPTSLPALIPPTLEPIPMNTNLPRIIGLSGKKGSGKDTCALILQNLTRSENGNHQYQTIAFATPIKDICQQVFKLSAEQVHDPILKEVRDPFWNKTPRQIMQQIGTDLFRNHFDQDIWIKVMERKLQQEPESRFIITDVRFPNESALIHRFGGKVLNITRDSEKINYNTDDSHSSEIPLDESNFNAMIENNSSIDELTTKLFTYLFTFK